VFLSPIRAMTNANRSLYFCSAGAFAALLLAAPIAFAHGDDDRERTPRTPQSTAGEEPGAEVDEESRWSFGVDFVAGFGQTQTADQIPPGSANINPINKVEADPIATDSFVFSLGYEPVKHLGFGVRFPVITGTVTPPLGDAMDPNQPRDVSGIGNLELETEYSVDVAKHTALVLSLGLALPTAQGSQVPATTAGLGGTPFDQTAYDRFTLGYAAAASRGFEENALFFADRFGIIPKLALEYHEGGVRLEPYVKLENMISTAPSQGDIPKYIGELVIGARAAYRVASWFEPGVRLWTTIVLTPSDQPVAVVEPELRFHLFRVLTPYIGGIIPFAGPLAHSPSQFGGVRLGAAVAF
jgi:hypothetical protein